MWVEALFSVSICVAGHRYDVCVVCLHLGRMYLASVLHGDAELLQPYRNRGNPMGPAPVAMGSFKRIIDIGIRKE